ncbi:MAG: PLP-dependent aminotransferase family protein [Oscillibacter sp.]|nr:PLP-dependent aminotransferase family protein [Oscillibacter sp.]
MRTYNLEERGNTPLYEYLYRCIRGDILSGALQAEEKLPSKRALAEHLHLSVITVENAYAQLTAEGYLTARPKRGYFVSRVERPPTPRKPAAQVLPERPAPVWKLDCKTNRVDSTRFPFAVWSHLTRQVLSQEGTALLAPVPHQGLPALRRAIADDLRDYRGMTVSPEQILVGAGAEYLYLLLAQLLAENAPLAVEDPGYPRITQIYSKSGLACVPVPLDEQGLRLDALQKSGAGAVHISPSHHYPTGIVMPIARRQALLRWAEERNGIIIEDDYDSEFRFAGRPIPTLQSIDTFGRVIYMNTFSQTIAPSMRIGFLVLPPELLARYRRELDFYACPVPATEQAVLTRFLNSGQYEQHLSRMRSEYRLRRFAVLEAFRKSAFADRITITEHGAGLHFLLKIDTETPDDVLRRRAEAMGVRLGFLSEYTKQPDESLAHTLVVNYAGLESAALPEAMELLGKVLYEA